jgi:predicted phage terminase large subunit-like protein
MLQAVPPCSRSNSRVAWTLRRSRIRASAPALEIEIGLARAGRASRRRHRRAAAWSKPRGSRATRRTTSRRISTRSCRAGTPPTRRASSAISASARAGDQGQEPYLLHVLRKHMEYPELERALREQCETVAAHVVLIEDKASGTQLIQEPAAESMHAVTRYQPQSDKIMRMLAQAAMIENGFVHLPKEAAWLAEYLQELTVSRRASTTTRSTRPPRCSTGSSARARSRRTGCGKCINKPRRGPEPARPDPLSVMTKAWASSARYDHAEREERMLQMARPSGVSCYLRRPSDTAQKVVATRHLMMLLERPRNPQGGRSQSDTGLW